MQEIIVLGGSYRETKAFAEQVGRRARHVNSARMLHGMHGATINVLPGFHTRPDRHAINSELRHRRGVTRVHYLLVDGRFVTPAEDGKATALGPDMVAALAGDAQLAIEAPKAASKPAPKRAKKTPAKPEPLADKPGPTPAGRGNLFDFLDGQVE